MIRKFFRPAFAILFLVMLFSCSTKKNTFLSRNYHSVTAQFNGFYNAKLKVEDGAQKLADSDKDDYNKILHVFKYGDIAKAKAIFPQMDDAIKRCLTEISNNSISIRGHEYCKWIDENWLLIGKAQFYKHDYFPATETFQYISANYLPFNSKR